MTTDASFSLDTPAQITSWYYLSAVSQLSSEVATGQNWYGKRSVYSGIRGNIVPADMVPARATKINKILMLAMLLHDQPSGPVVDRARQTLQDACEAAGIVITLD